MHNRWCVFAVLLAMLSAAWLASEARAQPRPPALPEEVTTAQTITDEQRGQIRQYLDHWVNQLVTALGEQPTDLKSSHESHSKLAGPLRGLSISQAFRNAYGQEAAAALDLLLDSDVPLQRINGYVAAAHMRNPALVAVALKGLAETDPAVRYLAAQVAANAADSASDATNPNDSKLTDEQQAQLVAAINQAMADERMHQTLKQSYLALNALTVPGARDAVLNLLINRADNRYHKGLNQGLAADREGLYKLYRKLFVSLESSTLNLEQDEAHLRRLCTAMAKFLQVLSNGMADEEQVDRRLQPIVSDLADTADQIFAFALDRFDPSQSRPPLKEPLRQNWSQDDFRLNVALWVGSGEARPGILTESRISIPYAELQLPPPPESPVTDGAGDAGEAPEGGGETPAAPNSDTPAP